MYAEHTERIPTQQSKRMYPPKVKISTLDDDFENMPAIESLDIGYCSNCIYSSGDLPSFQCIVTNKCKAIAH